jgi:hypothetical protein
MAVIQGRTRKELRQSIGYNLGSVYVSTATGGSSSTVVDTSLTTVVGGNDDHIGKWLVFTSGALDGTIARVTDYVASTTTLSFQPTASATASGLTYELWDGDFAPARIHDFINQSIIEATGHVYDMVEDVSLHSDGHTLRFDIPSGISMIQDIYYRDSVEFTRLLSCNAVFDETIDSDFTVTVDTEDKKQGTGSNKFVIAAGASAGDIATDSITSKDISKYDYLEGWVKIALAAGTSAGNLKILLDNTASCATPLETLSLPALTNDTWTFFRVALGNPELDTAIISVGLEYDSDLGACTVWLDDLSVVRNDSAYWRKVPRNLWRVDKQATDLVFDEYLDGFIPYTLIKLVGGDKPALLSADSTTNEIDDSFIIARATGLAFSASSGGPNTDPDARRQQAAFWFGLSQAAKRNFPMLVNVRTVA